MSLDLAECSDGELAALAIGGRQSAYTELMRRHREAIFRFARAHTADDDAALDITQQTFIAGFAALKRYDRSRPMKHWLTRIALNKCRDWGRRRKVRALFAFAAPLEGAPDPVDPSADVEREASDRQELAEVMHAMVKLPAKLKEVLVLRAVEGASQAEAAAILGITEKAVETRLHRARNKLQEVLRA
ncbi:RNA polymerase sigma factor [Sphingobium sp. AR-3-1]|uniref:RNA polymerase sigma factor CnrH n=2 Tax=Sphingomonadales TaxID=204457 RepID=A0A1S1HHQ3_9SPHN|nr:MULTISPECIES: RNA polymerase sigma factor [Sphingomonadaceae]NML10316.1 RNA polymerase sigma factor [Sphingobium psychrophilum]OHT21794.1 RNA polymerase sigma factor CnrH [Sphingomonas haloaromaticamans]